MLVAYVVVESAVLCFEHADNSFELFVAVEFGGRVLKFFELFGVKGQCFAVVEYSRIKYLRLYQILKDMTAVGELGIVARFSFFHFTNYVKAADIRERRRYSQLVG